MSLGYNRVPNNFYFPLWHLVSKFH
jgi:hypothetical protein